MLTIENWYVRKSGEERSVLCGNAFGHPRFPNAHPITTSWIVGKRDGKIVTYSGSHYTLGASIDREYPTPEALLHTLGELPDAIPERS